MCVAGLFSGLVSHVVSAKFRYPQTIAHFASPASVVQKTETWAGAVAASSSSAVQAAAVNKIPPILPSLGASGAIYATATMTALAFPDSQVALYIPPTYPINIQYGISGLMMIDVIGVLRGWRSVVFISYFIFRSFSQLNTLKLLLGPLIIGRTWEVLLLVSLIIILDHGFGINYGKSRRKRPRNRQFQVDSLD